MKNLIKKEISLCLHPASVIFLFFGAFVFIPNYPYEVMFFFNGLGVFFICLTGRENGDLAFTCTLPVAKKKVAHARIVTCMGLQVVQLFFATVCVLLKSFLFPMENYAGMDANLALLGLGFLMFALFNLIYFPTYFSNPNKVGIPFVCASAALFLVVVTDVVLSYAAPFYAAIDTPDFSCLLEQVILLTVGIVAYLAASLGALVLSGKAFEKFDL